MRLKHLLVPICGLVSACSTLAMDLGDGYSCPASMDPQTMIKGAQKIGAISIKPIDQTDGLLKFQVRPGQTVFGYELVAVTAASNRGSLFPRMPGTALPTPVHVSMVVKGNRWAVEMAAKKQGITVSYPDAVKYPRVVIEAYNTLYQEILPKNVDPAFAYTKIACIPRSDSQ